MQLIVDESQTATGSGARSARSLVMVHSLLTDSRAFDPVIPALTEHRQVARVSLPGFGTTPALDTGPKRGVDGDGITIFDLAAAVADGIDSADLGPKPAVLGNGLGAFVVAALAIEHGHRFGPIVLANGGSAFSDERRGAFTTMSELVSTGGMEAVVDVAVKRIFTELYLAAHPKVIDERRSVLIATDPGAFSAACLALRDLDLRPRLSEIANPILVVAGGGDQTTPPEMARELAEGINGARLVELDGCGHCPPLEQPDAFADVVRSFLRAHDGDHPSAERDD